MGGLVSACHGEKNSAIGTNQVKKIVAGAPILMARPSTGAGVGAEAMGNDPETAGSLMPNLDRKQGRLRERMLEQRAERWRGGIGVETSMSGAGGGSASGAGASAPSRTLSVDARLLECRKRNEPIPRGNEGSAVASEEAPPSRGDAIGRDSRLLGLVDKGAGDAAAGECDGALRPKPRSQGLEHIRFRRNHLRRFECSFGSRWAQWWR